jgi:hypothetical protein
MKRILLVPALTALDAAASLCVAAHAQTGPSGPPTVAPTPPTPTNPAPPSGILSEQGLEAVIKALDSSYKVYPINNGKDKMYYLKVTRDGWSYNLRIESCGDCLWLNADLGGVIAAPQNLPAAALAELLKLQMNIGPMHFVFNKSGNGFILCLCHRIDRHTTAEGVGAALNAFLKTVRESYPTWSQVR